MKISDFFSAYVPMTELRRDWHARAAAAVLSLLLVQPAGVAADAAVDKSPLDPVMKVMSGELQRATVALAKSDPAPYYLGYTVYEQDSIVLVGSYGSLVTDTGVRRRQAEAGDKMLGYNVVTDEIANLQQQGIIDPAKVTRSAVQNAASIAAMILTTEALITDVKEKNPQPAPQMPEY